MSPELRRFLGPARSLHSQPEAAAPQDKVDPPERDEPQAPELPPEREEEREPRHHRQRSSERESGARTTSSGVALAPNKKLSRAVEMQTALLIIGGLFLLVGIFYAGKKFEYLKYVITSRNKPTLPRSFVDKFPNLSSEELVEEALVAERLGNWQEAAERFIAAKRKNIAYRGILFRVGKLYYDHGNFTTADELFERAVSFGEDAAEASYLRGAIAFGHDNFPAAESFFEAAANFEPFAPQHYYHWAEALRKDRRFNDAISIYERGLSRAAGEQEKTIYRFKVRMTMVEAGKIAPLSAEIETKQRAGPISTEWLMTAAALLIHEGNVDEAVQLIDKARMSDYKTTYGSFASFAGDMFFANACQKYPEVARACGVLRTRP